LPHSFPNVAATLDAPSSGVTVYAPLLHEEDPAWRIDPIADLVTSSDVVLAMTTWERDRLIEAYCAIPEHTYVAPPTIDPPAFETVTSYEHDIPYVVAIGRRTRSKELLMSARSVDNMNTDGRRVHLIVAGPGSDPDLDGELRHFGHSVELLGEVTEETKWSLIKGSVASVSMSASESFGIGITEAWAMRRPVIARRVGAIESVMDDGVGGFLVDGEQDLTNRLEILLTDPDRADRMGRDGNQRIRAPKDASASTVLSGISAALDRRYNHPVNGGTPFDGS
jgi:glycosyltransferase involved in cell wall biosynthesis